MNQEAEIRQHLSLVSDLTDDEFADALEFEILQVAAVGLMKRWFPTKISTDIEKWVDIAYEDVAAILRALNEKGYTIKQNDERIGK